MPKYKIEDLTTRRYVRRGRRENSGINTFNELREKEKTCYLKLSKSYRREHDGLGTYQGRQRERLKRFADICDLLATIDLTKILNLNELGIRIDKRLKLGNVTRTKGDLRQIANKLAI